MISTSLRFLEDLERREELLFCCSSLVSQSSSSSASSKKMLLYQLDTLFPRDEAPLVTAAALVDRVEPQSSSKEGSASCLACSLDAMDSAASKLS